MARLRVDGDARRCSGGFRARGRLRRGATRRGEGDGVDGVDGGPCYGEGVEDAAAKLRRDPWGESSAAQNEQWGGLRVRQDTGKELG